MRARLTNLLDSTGGRVGAASALLAGTLVIASSAVSYWYARDLARQKQLAAMELAAADEATRLADGLESFSRAIAALASDETVGASVVDSEGRQRHLAPILRLVQSTLVRQFAGQSDRPKSVAPAVAVLDYRGRWLLGSPGAFPADFANAPWVQDTASGTPRAHYDDRRRVLYIAHPVVFLATGKPEGILIGIVTLVDAITGSPRTSLRAEAFGTEHDIAALTSDRGFLAAARRLPLAGPLVDQRLFYAVGIANEALDAEALAILRPHLAIALAGLAAAALLGIAMGKHLGRPLTRFADAVLRLGLDAGDRHERFADSATDGSSEVRFLARSLDDALAALSRSSAQAHLAKAALDAARDGMMIVDTNAVDWPLTYVNRAYEVITGYHAEEVLGRNCRFLHARNPTQPALDHLRDGVRKSEPRSVLLRNFRKDGTPFWNELSIAPVRGLQGQVTHYVGIMRDVSDRLRAEESLREAQKLESLGQLTGGLAHDFNNLLGIIIGNLDLLAEAVPEGSAERARCENALDAALRGVNVTRSLLAVAQRQRLEPQAVDVNERLRGMLPLIENTVGRRVQVRAEFSGDPMDVRVDIGGLDAVLLNLSINARDAMAQGSGTLRLHTAGLTVTATDPHPEHLGLPPGRYVCIEVIDDGCGMSDEVRAKAFEPFVTTKATGQGTGLGLSMTYGFARQSGGTATLRSAPGAGTVATLILPLVDRPISG